MFFYRQNGTTNWVPAVSTNILDYGNGMYLASFVAQNTTQGNPLPVSVNCIDTRAISVWTNTTCNQKN
jgi:hypothetical protein